MTSSSTPRSAVRHGPNLPNLPNLIASKSVSSAHTPASVEYTHLELVPWSDTTVERCGHDPRSAYVERFWLGILGPSAVWFLRLARRELDAATPTAPAILDLHEAARQLGLGHRGGRHSPLMRSIQRCSNFGTTRLERTGTLAVRTHLPPVPSALYSRLPDPLREELRQWNASDMRHPDQHELRRVAATMMGWGLGLHESAERLTAWGVGLEPARHAVAWAWSTACEHPSAAPADADQDPTVTRS